MKHIALRARSVHSLNPYTAPGLGDRIHSALIGWVYGRAHDTPVTLHLTGDKWKGGQFGNKSQSWAEVIGLFPDGSIAVCPHPVTPQTERKWLEHLNRRGYRAELYSYCDYPGQYESVAAFDISPYLKRIPLLCAESKNIDLPERFVTVQWDSNASARTLPDAQRTLIVGRYKVLGYKPVVVGGESKDERLRWSLKHIAYAMSKAAFHVGVDSAFFHMAQLYMPWNRIHLYNKPDGFLSHHALRAKDNGAQINLYL